MCAIDVNAYEDQVMHSVTADLPTSRPSPSAAFDAITRLTTRLFDAPMAMISAVDPEAAHQALLSTQGLPEPWAGLPDLPVSHSFCQRVQRAGAPLVIEDARDSSDFRDAPAITALNMAAYLGVPVRNMKGEVVCVLGVAEGARRDWTEDDIATMQDLALCVGDEFERRHTVDAAGA